MERRLVSMKLDRPNNVRRGQRITSKAMRRNVPRFSLFSLKESRNTLTGGGGVALLDSVWKVWRTYESLANVWKVWRTPFGLSGIYNDLNNVQWAMHLFWKQLQFKSQIRLALDIIWLLKADSFQGCGRGGGVAILDQYFTPICQGKSICTFLCGHTPWFVASMVYMYILYATQHYYRTVQFVWMLVELSFCCWFSGM